MISYLNPAACYVVYSCLYIVLQMSSIAGMLFQSNLAGYLRTSRSSFTTSFVTVLPAVAVADRFERNSLLLLFCFEVRFSSNTVKKNVFICWLLTLFKSAKKSANTPYVLRTHFTQVY